MKAVDQQLNGNCSSFSRNDGTTRLTAKQRHELAKSLQEQTGNLSESSHSIESRRCKSAAEVIGIKSLNKEESCTKLEAYVVTAPAQSYPRVKYAQRHGKEIIEGVPESVRDMICKNNNWDSDTIEICVVNWSGFKPDISTDDLQLRKSSNIKTNKVQNDNINSFISNKEIRDCKLKILLVGVKDAKDFLDQEAVSQQILDNIIFVAANIEERDTFTATIGHNKVAVSVAKDLPTEISKLLEMIVYRSYHNIVNTIESEILPKYQKEQQYDESSTTRLLQRSVKRFTALFLRSNVPSRVCPDAVKTYSKISCPQACQVVKNLRIKEGLKCCAFSNGKLEVFVDGTSNIIEDIQERLQELEISAFEIIQITERPYCTLESGSKITKEHNQKFGTLGAIVVWKKDGCERKCAITAEHVVNGSKSLYWVHDQNLIRIGKILRRRTTQSLGCLIGVTKLVEPYYTGGNFRFKNWDDTYRKGRIADFTQLQEFITVYLRGSQTALGTGLIRSLNAAGPAGRNDLILVEDVIETAPFCAIGDSGAVVFTDDPDDEYVDIIGLLEGAYKDRNNPNCPTRAYAVIRIQEGFTELAGTFGGTFELVHQENPQLE